MGINWTSPSQVKYIVKLNCYIESNLYIIIVFLHYQVQYLVSVIQCIYLDNFPLYVFSTNVLRDSSNKQPTIVGADTYSNMSTLPDLLVVQ